MQIEGTESTGCHCVARDFCAIGRNAYSGEYCHAEAEGIDFCTVKAIDLNKAFENLYAFWKMIEQGVQTIGVQWHFRTLENSLEKSHVTVRKDKGRPVEMIIINKYRNMCYYATYKRESSRIGRYFTEMHRLSSVHTKIFSLL